MKVELILGILSFRLDNMNCLVYTMDNGTLPTTIVDDASISIYNNLADLLDSVLKINTSNLKFDLINVVQNNGTISIYYGIAVPISHELKHGRWNSIEKIIMNGGNDEFSKLVQLLAQKTKFYR